VFPLGEGIAGRRLSEATVVLAVSGHGFGHAVRCAEVARALLGFGARVLLRSEAPVWLFPPGVEVIPSPGWPLDIGVAQQDGLEFDIDATRRRWRDFAASFATHAQAEADTLRALGADVLLGDIPPLAFAAAKHAGIPSVALANFGWDWIYAGWPGFESAIACVQRGYSQADRLLRLPLHSPAADAFPAFATIEDVPLIGRQACCPPERVRRDLGIDDDRRRLVLLGFGGFAARGLQPAGLAHAPGYTFVVTPPLSQTITEPLPNLVRLAEQPHDYVSLLAACDAVVTKPGYGIVADCLTNQVPILYTDRGPFREYDVLVTAIHRLGRGRYVPRQDLLAGRLGPHLDALLEAVPRWAPLRCDGARVVAARTLELSRRG